MGKIIKFSIIIISITIISLGLIYNWHKSQKAMYIGELAVVIYAGILLAGSFIGGLFTKKILKSKLPLYLLALIFADILSLYICFLLR